MIDLKREIERELGLIDPPDLWDRIQADASSSGDAAVLDLATTRHRRRPSLWLAVAAVTVLLALVGALALIDDGQTVDTTPVTDVPVVPEPPTTYERPTTIAKAEDMAVVGPTGGGLAGRTLNIDAVEQDGEVTGEFRVNNLVVTLQCADTNLVGDLILGGEVTADPDGLLAEPYAIGDDENTVAVGGLLALLIREYGPDGDRVSSYANDSAGSCTELVDGAAQRPTDGGFFAYTGNIETNLVLLSGTPTCEEWTERKVTADDVAPGCRDGDALAETVAYVCIDDRVLYQNDRVWGWVGEPAHAHEDGAERVAPDAEREACGPGATT